MQIKLSEDFEEHGLQSEISFQNLKEILKRYEELYWGKKDNTEITGFTITDWGIKIHKRYKEEGK